MLCSRLPNLITMNELAKKLNLQPETIRLAVKARAIPYYGFTASTIRFDLDEVRAVIEAVIRERDLAKGKGPPQKNGAEVATSTRNHNAQKKSYVIGTGNASRKFSGRVVWLIAELASIRKALLDPRLRDFERRNVRILRQSTFSKLRVL